MTSRLNKIKKIAISSWLKHWAIAQRFNWNVYETYVEGNMWECVEKSSSRGSIWIWLKSNWKETEIIWYYVSDFIEVYAVWWTNYFYDRTLKK